MTAAATAIPDTVAISGRVPEKLKRRTRMYAASVGVPLQTIIEDALTEYLDRRNAPVPDPKPTDEGTQD